MVLSVNVNQKTFKMMRCKFYIRHKKSKNKIFRCPYGERCLFAHDIIYYNRLPSHFKKLQGLLTKVGVLDGHIETTVLLE
tara:strand:- start:5440 stop:5679 length:240 start_codon:yes stop_codon:yes gene_type:complete